MQKTILSIRKIATKCSILGALASLVIIILDNIRGSWIFLILLGTIQLPWVMLYGDFVSRKTADNPSKLLFWLIVIIATSLNWFLNGLVIGSLCVFIQNRNQNQVPGTKEGDTHHRKQGKSNFE